MPFNRVAARPTLVQYPRNGVRIMPAGHHRSRDLRCWATIRSTVFVEVVSARHRAEALSLLRRVFIAAIATVLSLKCVSEAFARCAELELDLTQLSFEVVDGNANPERIQSEHDHWSPRGVAVTSNGTRVAPLTTFDGYDTRGLSLDLVTP
jgi:hypothetical protein